MFLSMFSVSVIIYIYSIWRISLYKQACFGLSYKIKCRVQSAVFVDIVIWTFVRAPPIITYELVISMLFHNLIKEREKSYLMIKG